MSVDLSGFGHRESAEITGNDTLVAADSGVVQNVTATAVVTLPATAVGDSYVVRVGAPGITVSVSPAAADNIRGGGLSAVDNKDLVFTNQPAGSFVKLVADGSAGFVIQEISGTATKEA